MNFRLWLAGFAGCVVGVFGTLLLSQAASSVYMSEMMSREEQELSGCGYEKLAAAQWTRAEQCLRDYVALKALRARSQRGRGAVKWPLLFPALSVVLSEVQSISAPTPGSTIGSKDVALHTAMLGLAIESSGSRQAAADQAYEQAATALGIGAPEAREIARRTLKEFQR